MNENPLQEKETAYFVRWTVIFLLCLPLAGLTVQATLWVRYGVDLPFIDDWRDFSTKSAASLALKDLFRPANDTIYATGKLLDALAVRILGYNGVVYQLLTLLSCIGLAFFLQYRLLFRTMPLLPAAFGFFCCIAMVQAQSYWGLQNLAYHQIIPLLALLSSLVLILSSRIPSALLSFVIAFIMILSGFAYISGAITTLVAACVLVLIALRLDNSGARRLYFAAGGFTVAAIVTLPVQLWVILVFQSGATHSTEIPWTMPWQLEFWVFLVGIIGRTINLQSFATTTPLQAAMFAVILAAALIALALISTTRLLRNREKLALKVAAPDIVYLTLFCCVGTYTLMIAASRASAGAVPDYPLTDWFWRGGSRFHYFWITVLLPWLAAFLLAPIASRMSIKKTAASTIIMAIGIVGYSTSVGLFDYASYYIRAGIWRQSTQDCIQQKILMSEKLVCGEHWETDLTDAVNYAREIDVSFTRALLFQDEVTTNGLGRVGAEKHLQFPELVVAVNSTADLHDERIIRIKAADKDPNVYLRFGDEASKILKECRILRISGTIQAPSSDLLQIFITSQESPSIHEDRTAFFSYTGGSPQTFDMRIDSRGKLASDIRIDPGNFVQSFELSELSFRCR